MTQDQALAWFGMAMALLAVAQDEAEANKDNNWGPRWQMSHDALWENVEVTAREHGLL